MHCPSGYREPVLVSGTDGVGTKLKWAFQTGRHDTVGIDLVAMCVNDILVTSADPLFFLDYFATSKLDVAVGEAVVVAGIAEGCRQAGCALLGGETAELPGMYADGEYDLAGFVVGVADKHRLRHGRDIVAGDALVGVASDGLHSNGHSLARKALVDTLGLTPADRPDILGGAAVVDEVLRPTRIYKHALAAASDIAIKGAAHITGGGLVENPVRFLAQDAGLGLELHPDSWPVPPIFELVQSAGIEPDEMRRTFNMGLGLVLAVAAADASRLVSVLEDAGERAWVVGQVTAGPRRIAFG